MYLIGTISGDTRQRISKRGDVVYTMPVRDESVGTVRVQITASPDHPLDLRFGQSLEGDVRSISAWWHEGRVYVALVMAPDFTVRDTDLSKRSGK